MDDDDKRWSFQEEISKLFNASLRESFPELEEEAVFYASQTGEPGDYICQNVLTIWLKLRNSPDLTKKYQEMQKPKDIGEAIKRNLRTYAIDMIGKEHSVPDVGFVPLSLSGKWLAKSIHMMLKHGIETWAPKLPVKMVSVKFPTLNDENRVGVFRREAIKLTLLNMLKYSKVGIQPEPKVPDQSELRDWGAGILKKSFLIEDRETHVVIKSKQTVPFILSKEDFCKSCIDLNALREVTESETVDWVVFVAPVRQQEYIEMCFTAARHEKWIVTDRKVQWNPTLKYEYPVATYAGHRTCSTEQGDLLTLLRQVEAHCDSVAEGTPGEDGLLLGYSTENVFHGVLLYTCLKNDRFADCTFNFNEMVEEKGNTFVYLLRTRAEIKSVTDQFGEHINELKNASNLIWKAYEELEESVEHVLEFHLLKFAEVFKESCLFVLPHRMCEYLYNLANKFNNYSVFMRKARYVAEKSKLLLCEATAVVMDKCFQVLGIDHKSLREAKCWYRDFVDGRNVTEPDKKKQKMVEIEETIKGTVQELKFENLYISPSFVSGARDPARKSRFELFSFCPTVTTSGGMLVEGQLFGLITVSDKYGIRSDGGEYIFEPDFPYVHLFDFEWRNPRDMYSGRVEPFGNPSSRRSVPFSSSIEIIVQLYYTSAEKDACFEISNNKITIDLSDFWGQNFNSTRSSRVFDIDVDGLDGTIAMYYIAIKDAVDATVEVKFNEGNQQLVYGHICAYYGGGFSCSYYSARSEVFMAALFASKFENGTLSLMRSELAVPSDATLMIRAHLFDPDTDEYVLADTHEFVLGDSRQYKMVGLRGATCSLELNVVWNC